MVFAANTRTSEPPPTAGAGVVQGDLERSGGGARVGHGGGPLDRANFTGFVLGCIEAKFCKKICI